MKKNNSLRYIIYGVIVAIISLSFIKSVNAEGIPSYSKETSISSPVMVSSTIENIFDIWDGDLDCTEQFKQTRDLLNKVFGYVRIGSALVFVILTSVEYIKTIGSSDAGMFKKTNSKTIKRLAALIVILILPSLIKLILALVQLKSGTCGVGY